MKNNIYCDSEYGSLFNNLRRTEFEILDKIFEKEKSFNNSTILDIGCGSCVQLKYLMKHGAKVIGLDLSLEMLTASNDKIFYFSLINGDALRLPFQSDKFDIALSIAIIHFVPTEKLLFFFKELRSVLKNGGKLYLATQSLDQISRRFESNLFPSALKYDLKRFHPVKKILYSLKKEGFSLSGVDEIISKPICIDEEHIDRVANRVLSFMAFVPEDELKKGLYELQHNLFGEQFVAEWTLISAM